MKKKSENTIKILALEISHVKGEVLSGGDKLLEEMSSYFSSRISTTVVVPQIAGWHWQKTKAKLIILPKNIFDDRFNIFAVFITYLLRIIKSTQILLLTKGEIIIYSSTNIFPDIVPAFIAKIMNPKKIWVARIHHLAPSPKNRTGNLIVNSISYITQAISLICVKKADKVAILNNNLLSTLTKKGFYKSKLIVLPAGIDSKKWQFAKSSKKFDAIFLGRLHPSKGIDDLIPIWKLVCQKLPKAKLIIAGQGHNNIIEKLKKEVLQAGLTNNIEIAGRIAEKKVKEFLSQSKIFLFLDHEAGFGIAPLEAMSQGLPVVGFDLGILGSTFKQGFLNVKPFNKNRYAKAVVFLFQNPKRLRSLSREALAEAQNHSWPPIAAKLENLFTSYMH